ncbi:Hypothetical protein CAP_5464 [Chondromyces apiculatus DSM 436]|uniref:Uncharacterized protein n=1 Tax=Chondromyces apiculatus DSM 436 TaxID=1192034 RepID=A0A017T3S8_9BACT|nr:Hypothetical protein CAP_5464 [Chondromyces apiculatus DSM 436]
MGGKVSGCEAGGQRGSRPEEEEAPTRASFASRRFTGIIRDIPSAPEVAQHAERFFVLARGNQGFDMHGR